MRINNNLLALNSHRQLGVNNKARQKSIERLSSGIRINRASDDAAGLAISEKMRGQIKGLNQAKRNAQDGISLLQTAEGALNETHSILQRMRELSVQSATDTNATERQKIASEIAELVKEINHIAENTKFNTQNLLDGSFDGKLQIGANSSQSLGVSIRNMSAALLGVQSPHYSYGTVGTVLGSATDVVVSMGTYKGSDTSGVIIDTEGLEVFSEMTVNGVVTTYAGKVTVGGTSIEIESSGRGVVTTGSFSGLEIDVSGVVAERIYSPIVLDSWQTNGDGTRTVTIDKEAGSVALYGGMDQVGTQNYEFFAIASDTGTLELDWNYEWNHQWFNANAKAQIFVEGPNGTTEFVVDQSSSGWTERSGAVILNVTEGSRYGVRLTASNSDSNRFKRGTFTFTHDFVDFEPVEPRGGSFDIVARIEDNSIPYIDNAIQLVSSERSRLGALQNRLEHTISNLGTSAENLQAAESRIRDLDMAKGMMEQTKQNILEQAATAMLAQANMAPQSVLQLLR